MVSYVRGIEIPVAGVMSDQRPRRYDPGITLPLTAVECDFLLVRIADVGGTAEAIINRQQVGSTLRLRWERKFVVTRLLVVRDMLLEHHEAMHVHTELDKAILVEAIEGNPYFAVMADDDPRLNVRGVQAANRLREKVIAAIGRNIAPVPLGKGRKRLPEKGFKHAQGPDRRRENGVRLPAGGS